MAHLLSDEQIRQFIVNGFISVKTNLPDAIHEIIFERSEKIMGQYDRTHNPGNNIMPEVPEIYEVLEAPEVHGALTSLLGRDYILNTHRHCHTNYPSENPQQTLKMGIHKDGHAGGFKPRHRVPRWAILFYFPTDCPIEQGPTCGIPGSQYYEKISDETMSGRDEPLPLLSSGHYQLPDHCLLPTMVPMAGEKGTVWIMHFDIYHTVFTNQQDLPRYGMKLVYTRTEEPTDPTWDNCDPMWRSPKHNIVPHDQTLLWNYIWNWMSGKSDRLETDQPSSGQVSDWIEALDSNDPEARTNAVNQIGFFRNKANEAIPHLIDALSDPHEPVRRNATYALASIGRDSVPALIEQLDADRDSYETNPMLYPGDAAHALGAIGRPAIPALQKALKQNENHIRGRAAYALGEMDGIAKHAVPDLVRLAQDHDSYLKRHVISALGMIKQPAELITPAIGREMENWEEDEIGFYAAQAFQRLGPLAEDSIPVLTRGLRYGSPYVAGSCAEALTSIGTPEALRSLTRFLRVMRWYDAKPVRKVILQTPFDSTAPVDTKALETAITSAAKSQDINLDPIREIRPQSSVDHIVYFETGERLDIRFEKGHLQLYKKLRLKEDTE